MTGNGNWKWYLISCFLGGKIMERNNAHDCSSREEFKKKKNLKILN